MNAKDTAADETITKSLKELRKERKSPKGFKRNSNAQP